LPIGWIASVASFFISRVDTKVDPLLVAKAGKAPVRVPVLQRRGSEADRVAAQAARLQG
jgi:hypothetical protein